MNGVAHGVSFDATVDGAGVTDSWNGDEVHEHEGAPQVMINRPFMFAVQDQETQAILFMGRVVEP